MKHAFYQQLYEAEFQRRDHLQSAVGTPFSVLVLVGTGLVLLAQKFRTPDTLLQTLFWVSYATAVVAFAVTVYMLIRSFHGYVYERFPSRRRSSIITRGSRPIIPRPASQGWPRKSSIYI